VSLNFMKISISSQVSSFLPPKNIAPPAVASKQVGSFPTFSLASNISLMPPLPNLASFAVSLSPMIDFFPPGPPPDWGSSKSKLVPIADQAPQKDSTIGNANNEDKSSLSSLSAKNETSQAPKTNQEIAMDEKRIEPIAIFNLKTSDFKGDVFSPLQAAVVQAFLEDRISQEFSTSIFEKLLAEDDSAFSDLDVRLSQQISSAQNAIDQLRSIFKVLQLVHQSMSPQIEKKSISLITTQIMNDLCKVEPLLVASQKPVDPMSIVRFFSPQRDKNPLKSRTALITQVLQIASQALFRCYTPLILGNHLLNSQEGLFSVATGKKQYSTDIKSLSMKNSPAQNYIYGLANETAYVSLDFYRKMIDPSDKKSLALVTMLANEYAISAGLGRLAETPLGNRFGSNSQNYINTFLGTQEIQDASQETTQPNSLVDDLVIAPDGSAQTQAKNRVLLLDSNDVISTQENTEVNSSFNEFMTSVTRSPLTNKMNLFDDALVRAGTSMDEGLQFYKKLHLRDQEPVLLTPRGLYTGLLDEVSVSLSQMAAGKNSGKKLSIVELAVMREIASTGKSSDSKWSPANIVKRYLLSLMAKKAALKLSGKDFQQFKSDAAAGKKSQQSTTTEVNIKEGDETDGKTYTITTSQKESDSGAVVTFSNDVVRFSPNDSNLIGEKMQNAVPNEVVKALLDLSRLQTPPAAANEVIIKMFPSTFFEQIYESDTSLLSRIVGIFISMHEEAKGFSKTENEDATWLGPDRLTRNSQIDGTLSISILFEAALDLISMFTDSAVRKDFVGRFSVVAPVGPDTQNFTGYHAARLLVQGSKANDFTQLLSDNNRLPDLDNRSIDSVVTAQLYPHEKSFRALQSNFTGLAEERDAPFVSLASARGLIAYTKQQTKILSGLGAMLRGDKDPDDLAKALRSFAQEQLGKEFLDSVTDYSLDIAQDRLNDIRQGKERPSKRLEKLSMGEKVCIEAIIRDASTKQTDNIVFCSFGLPGNFISSQLKFSLDSGHEANIEDEVMSLSIFQDGVFDNALYKKMSKDFFVTRFFDRNSFSGFGPKTVSKTDIVNKMMLANGQTGAEFADKHKNPAAVRQVLENEMTSHLMKKALSLLSTVDMTEENLVKIDYEKRSPGAKDLAQKISEVAGLPKKTFDGIFSTVDGVTRLSETMILKSIVSHVTKTTEGQIFEPAVIDLGTAELFYDIFSSPYFYDGLIRERVFSPVYFDKVLGCFFDSGEFVKTSDGNIEIIKGGERINTGKAKDMARVATSTTQGTVSIMTYSAEVNSASPVV